MPVFDKKRSTSESKLCSDVLTMNATISALEDTSSVIYEGRAEISHMEDILAMENDDWRNRLKTVIQNKGRSKRSISKAIGNGDGYVHSILEEGKDPTISNLMAVCQELNVSLSYILYGFNISGETEEILALLEGHPNAREGVLKIL